jgi:hypothetical protein
MKHLIALMLLPNFLSAQTPAPVEIKVRVKGSIIEKVWSIILRPRTVATAINCTATEMEPGESTDCTVTINQPARAAGAEIEITMPPGISGPNVVSIGAGQTTRLFQISRPTDAATMLPPWEIYTIDGRRYVALVAECKPPCLPDCTPEEDGRRERYQRCELMSQPGVGLPGWIHWWMDDEGGHYNAAISRELPAMP